MAKQILVPITRNDRVKGIIHCVERIAQPGMKVVFLLQFPLDGFDGHLRAARVTEETAIYNPTEVRKIAEGYTWESQQRLAQQKVLPTCETLQKKGAEVAVDVYTGSLGKAVRSYELKGDIHLIMQRAGIGHIISRFLNSTISALRSSKRPSPSPVFLTHPCNLL